MNSLFSGSRWFLLALACLLNPVFLEAQPPNTNPPPPPVIISPTEATAVVTQSFNYQIVLDNFQTATYSATGLADGLSLDSASGVISGVPTTIGTFTATLTATNANGKGGSTLTIQVLPAVPPVISSAGNVTTIKDAPFSYQIVADSSPTSYGAEGLPDGLVLNPETGLISGVPTAIALYKVTLSATNVRGTGTLELDLSVVPSIPTVSLVADRPDAYPLRNAAGRFTISREGGDLTQPLLVVISVKGTAKNGEDYPTVSYAQIIKRNKPSCRVKINAFLPPDGVVSGKKTVKFTLQRSDAYQLGEAATAKVKISYAP